MFYLFRNPPIKFLQAELEPLIRWVIWLAQANPRLVLAEQSETDLGNGLYRLELVVDNAGWLPTYGSQKALEGKLVRGIRVELGGYGELIEGKREQQLGQLEGICGRPVSPLWHKGDASDYRVKVSWVVRAGQGPVSWKVLHDRAGRLEGQFLGQK